MTDIILQQLIKVPTGHQLMFLRNLDSWDGAATTGELGPQTSQKENSARQTCKRRGWVTFDRYYWRLTDAGRAVLLAVTRQQSGGIDV